MYTNRIAKWGLEKKRKSKEMKAIIRKERARTLQGKSSIFRARGRTIDYRDVVSYWKRKQMSIDDVLALSYSREVTPEALECLTPVPSPISAPAVLSVPERLFKAVSDYFHGLFDSGTLYSVDPAKLCASAKEQSIGLWSRFVAEIYDAYYLFDCGNFREAGQHLRSAFAVSEEILLVDHPMDLLRFVFNVLRLQLRGRPEILSAFVRHFTDMSQAVLGKGHPVPLITSLFSAQGLFAQRDCIEELQKSIRDAFEQRLGSTHSSTMEVRYGYSADERSIPDTINNIRKDIPGYEALFGVRDPRCVKLHLLLGQYCAYIKQYDEVEKQALHLLQLCRSTVVESTLLEGLRLLSVARFGQSFIDDGEAYGRQYIHSRMTAVGVFDTYTRQYMITLERQLISAGRWESAKQIAQWRTDIGTAEANEHIVEDATVQHNG